VARGGKREGAGRKTGSLTKRTQEVAAAALASGEMPMDYMLRVMRDPTVEHERRDRMAKDVAPYVHPRLATTEHTGKDGGPILVDKIERVIISGSASNDR
jgi:hypothetical protein